MSRTPPEARLPSHASAGAGHAIVVNGEPSRVAPGSSVGELLEQLGLGGRRVAVAVNRDVIPRSDYARVRLSDGDRIEILEAVGGG